MIMEEDGSYYRISCEKCGTEIRKHKSYGTRYGEAYYFNPELKCSNCGFSAKVVYGSGAISSSLSNASSLYEKDDNRDCAKCNSAQIITEDKKHSAEKAIAGVVLPGDIKVADFLNEKKNKFGRRYGKFSGVY